MKDNFDVMAVRLNRNKAVSVVLTIRFVIDRNAVTVGVARQTEFARVDDVVIDVDCTVTLRSSLNVADLDISGDKKPSFSGLACMTVLIYGSM